MHICVYIFICICIHINIYTCIHLWKCQHVWGPFSTRQNSKLPLAVNSGSLTCVIWGLCTLTWQVNLTSNNLSSDSNRGKWAMWQVNLSSQLVKLTSLSSGTCHRKWDLAPTENVCRRWPAISFRESLSRRRRCLRDVLVLFLHVVVCLKNMFSDGQDVKYDCDTTPRQHFFHGTNSHEATQVVHRKLGETKR